MPHAGYVDRTAGFSGASLGILHDTIDPVAGPIELACLRGNMAPTGTLRSRPRERAVEPTAIRRTARPPTQHQKEFPQVSTEDTTTETTRAQPLAMRVGKRKAGRKAGRKGAAKKKGAGRKLGVRKIGAKKAGRKKAAAKKAGRKVGRKAAAKKAGRKAAGRKAGAKRGRKVGAKRGPRKGGVRRRKAAMPMPELEGGMGEDDEGEHMA
jgi:hypothetical protein